jgi:hypothetical protein
VRVQKRMREGDQAPKAPKTKRLDRRRERRTVHTVIRQYVGFDPNDVTEEEA